LGMSFHRRNDLRYFYIIRNAFYIIIHSNRSYTFRMLAASRVIPYFFIYLILAHDKKVIFQATFHGLLGKLGPY
jgi:hypothetical protein